MAEQVKAISKDNWKWEIAELFSIALALGGFYVISKSIRLWPIAVILILIEGISAILCHRGPILKRQGKLSMSFLNTMTSKLVQKQTIVTVPLSVDGAMINYDKRKSIIRKLKGYPSGIETWEKFLETSCFLNKLGKLTLMEMNTTQTAILEHEKVNQKRMMDSKKPGNRRKIAKYIEAMDELAKVLGTTGLAIETYEGSIPEKNFSQYGNIESEKIDARSFINILKGIPMALNPLSHKDTSISSKIASEGFEFTGGAEPSIGNRYFKFLRITDYDPIREYKALIDVCRKNFAEPIITLEPMTPMDALKLLEKQRDRRNIKQQIAQNGTGGKNEQSSDEEDEHLEKIREFEKRIRKGEHTYKLFVKLRLTRNNTADLNDSVEKILQELELHGYEAVVPENQDDVFKEVVSMEPGEEAFGFHMLAKDLASVLMPLVKKSQMFQEPEGFAFGIADYGERVMKNIVKLLSGGIGLIIGLTGSGKSYLMAGMAYFMSFIGYRVVIFDPKGKGLKDVSFSRLLASVEGGTPVECESINVFDMFEDVETQKTYQRGAISILFKDISNDLVDMICEHANEFRDKGTTPTFELLKKSFKEQEGQLEEGQQSQDFIQSIKRENIDLKNIRKIIAYISSLTNEDRAKWFRTTPIGMRYPANAEIAADGFIGLDFSSIDDEFSKRAIMNLVLFQMQVQMLQKKKVQTILFIDEAHDVMEKSDLLGNPSSEAIIKKLANEGRAHGMIAIGAAQMIKTLIKSDAGKYLFENSSWLVQLGRPDSDDALKSLGAEEEDIGYLKTLTANEVGSGLLVVKGEKPLQFEVDFASYIHQWITGKAKSIRSNRTLGRVLRIEAFEKKHHRSLIKTMGYRSIRHRNLDGEKTDFLIKRAEDPEMTIDLFLIEEYLTKHGIRTNADYENGSILVNEGNSLLYIQPYNGNTPNPVSLLKQLDETTDKWFIIYHDKNFVAPIKTKALETRLISREDLPLNVDHIIK